jgi:hypothetical protein
MAKEQKRKKELSSGRAQRMKLSAEESLKRMEEFPKRKERFIAAVRKGKDRGISA